jgi:hypothetical protein
MITMDQVHHIRALFYEQDRNISEIAQELSSVNLPHPLGIHSHT